MVELSEIERTVGEAERATSVGDHAAAERALRRVLRLQEAGLELSHPDVVNTLNNLAVVCDRLGRPDEAEFLYRRALGIARRTLDPDHDYIATSLENLSNLYRAQGKPEKLEKIREGGSSGPGVSEFNVVDEAGEGVVVSEERAWPEASAQPLPVSAVLSDKTQRAQGNRPHLVFAATPHPVVFIIGVAALISVSWLLFSGTVDPDASGRDGVGTRLEELGGELGAGVVNQAGGSDASHAETVTAPPRVATVFELGTVPSALAPTDGVASANLPSLDRLPTAVSEASPEQTGGQPDSSPLSAIATSSVVADAEICSQLDTRAADGTPLIEWLCQPVGDDATPGRFFFYTRVRARTSTTVEHRWLRDGVLERKFALEIGANSGPGYRTYSEIIVAPTGRGTWRVELRLGERELHAQEFVVP